MISWIVEMIIGKTRNNLDFQTASLGYISKQKYYHISHFSRECLLECEIDCLPVSLNKIVKHFNIKTVTYSALKKLNIEKFNSVMQNNQGFAEKTVESGYYIFYDDCLPVTIQRFTVAHEIGHILLQHFEHDTLSREKEANMFASRLLMPMTTLKECNVCDEKEVEALCFVSLQAAKYRYQRLQEVLPRNKFYTDANESALKTQFYGFIKNYIKAKKRR